MVGLQNEKSHVKIFTIRIHITIKPGSQASSHTITLKLVSTGVSIHAKKIVDKISCTIYN